MFYDRESFRRIYDLHWKNVFGICYHQTQDAVVAEEIVQEIFCSLWERRESLEIEGPLENYLARAAKFKLIDYYRRKAKAPIHTDSAAALPCYSSENCTENDVLYHALSDKVGNLVDQLPCQCRMVYKMSREKGLTTKEIAADLLISEKTVKNHLTKALSFLKSELKEYQ
ncbi:RNA polymerase sigma-70 factor [Dyadobacter luteus]|uniref:RNA polymerase sigma-70 factor n=1 Tax=Dyadobacter luteus TaxID=2259619 RepID=A0A3D8YHL0_9BACT|nr:RNA polymerase sigma-70 factor [Dyadobacter luteus]REA64329.1 RNA polymerase sigma-70 factor [Dyadobacter luteus]